jgi:hypothetical protein
MQPKIKDISILGFKHLNCFRYVAFPNVPVLIKEWLAQIVNQDGAMKILTAD